MKRIILFALTLTTCLSLLHAQVWPGDTISPQINTGNPAFPFPQFLEYDFGKSLAANNADGVTHADMEKAMREGYKIMMRRALTVPGKTLDGTPYIEYNNLTVPQGYGTFVSEGDGYALLAAAYFADKKTFDGLWLWIHDNRFSAVKKYFDCTDLRPTYTYGSGFTGWESDENTDINSTNINSAADGDVDIALALLMAHKQWGDNMGITDGCGNEISYKDEAMKMITNLVDTLYYDTSPQGDEAGIKGYLSGIVGIDGYQKSGNTWGEVTNWRTSPANTDYPWAQAKPDPIQVKSKFVDYIAPSYFHQFALFLEENGGTAWQINQCKRSEASSDWTMGDMNAKGYISSAGNYTVSDDGSATTYGAFAAGEDFRLAWRTHLNYVWHGNPDSTWNPVTHQIEPGGNTFDYDMALRHKEFLKYPAGLTNTPESAFCSKLGASPDPGQPEWRGVAQIKQQYTVEGQVLANYGVNWPVATGTPAAVASEDLDLLAELYRQCELTWDDQSGLAKMPTPEERYILSTPKYFHGWFRLLGMLTASGNLHPPKDMVAAANLKVYMDVNKTFVYERDLLDYEVSYRNYGVEDALNTQITTTIDDQYEIVSISNGGVLNGNTITWDIGTVPGFQTGGLDITKGLLSFQVRVKEVAAANIVCLTSTITSSNTEPWTSNEYPNNASYTMERNCVDLLKDRVLAIKKTTDRAKMNPNDIVNFTLDFENKTGSNLWLDGGRDRVILSYANYHPNNGTSFYQFYRIWHTAHEAYINLGNYRVSYFMNDPAAIGLYDAATNPTGWDTYVDNQNDLDKYGYNPLTLPVEEQLGFTYQRIPWGEDANGAWNQRMITKFANVLTAPSTHVFDKLDSEYLIHKGVVGPGFTRTRYESKPSTNLGPRIIDDWSYDPAANSSNIDGQGDYFFPVTPTYTNAAIDFAPVEIDNYSKDACGGPVPNFRKVLFEEFDGYTWRRVAGNGPLPGRETYNVVVVDSIPIELTFKEFTDDEAVDIKATYTALTGNPNYSGIVKWEIPVMLTGEKGNISYSTVANDPPCPAPDKNFINAAWISSEVDSPDSSSVELLLTCNPVPPTPPTSNSLTKTADKVNVEENDNIVYTLNFTNKDGTETAWEGTATDPNDWQALGSGLLPDMNKTTLSLDQNNNTAKGTYAFGHKKAHGVNGWAEASILKGNSSPLSMIFRHSGGTPGQADFQGLRLKVIPNHEGDNRVSFEVFNNSTSVATFTKLTYPGATDPMNLRVQLIDDAMYIFINNFDGAPLKVVKGLTQLNAGYVGLYGSSSQQKLSAFSTGFDSAFDLVLSDQLPTELDAPSAISDGGTLAGGKITWPTIPGPILVDEVIERTFETTVNTCANFITNIGQADVYGISGILAQYVVNCASDDCTPPSSVDLTADKLATCEDSTITLTASAVGASFEYALYDANGIVETASTTNTFEVNKAGTYYVVVTDPVDPVLCTANTEDIEIIIYDRPDLSVTPPAAVCAPNTLDISSVWGDAKSTGGIVSYHHASPTSLANSISNASALDTSGTYYIQVDNNGCISEIGVAATINQAPQLEPMLNSSVCSGVASTADTAVSDIPTATYTWNAVATGSLTGFALSGTDPFIPSETITNTTGQNQEITYTLIATIDDCSSDPTDYTLTIHPEPTTPIINGAEEVCQGDTTIYTVTDDPSATYKWYATGTGLVADTAGNTSNTLEIIAGIGDYSISTQETNANGCISNQGELDVAVRQLAAPALVGEDANICTADDIILNGSDPSPGTGVWTLGSATSGVVISDLVDPTAASTLVNNVTGGDVIEATWTVSNGICPSTSDSYTITGASIASPTVNLSVSSGTKTVYCAGDIVNIKAVGTGGGSNPLYTFFDGLDIELQAKSVTDTFSIELTTDTSIYVELHSNSSCLPTGHDSTETSALLNFTVDQLPTASFAGDNDTICTSNYTLSANTPVSGVGTWSKISGSATIVDITNPTTTITGLQQSDPVTLAWLIKSTNEACSEARSEVVILRAGEMTSAEAGDDIVLCETDLPPLLTANTPDGTKNPPETSQWTSIGLATISPSGQTANLQVGENKFAYAIDNGLCASSIDSLIVFVDGLPEQAGVYNENSVLQTDDFELLVCSQATDVFAKLPNQGTGVWSKITNDTVSETIDNALAYINLLGLSATATEVQWTVSSPLGACPADSIVVSIKTIGDITPPTITIDGENTTAYSYSNQKYTLPNQVVNLCLDESYILTAPSLKANESLSWTYSAGVVVLADQGSFQEVQLSDTGAANTVTLAISNTSLPGCNALSYTFNLDVYDKPTKPSVTPSNLTICAGETQEFEPSSINADQFKWTAPFNLGAFDKSLTLSTSPNNIFRSIDVANDASGQLILMAENECGLSDETDISIAVQTLPNPAVSLLGNPNSTCTGSDLVISIQSQQDEGSSPSYTWKVNGIDRPETGLNILLENVQVTTIKVEVSMLSDATCVNQLASATFTDEHTITLQTPTVDISGGHLTTDVTTLDKDFICSDTLQLAYEVKGDLLNKDLTRWYISDGITETYLTEGARIQLMDYRSAIDIYLDGNTLLAYPEIQAGLDCPDLAATQIEIDVLPAPNPSIQGRNYICNTDQFQGMILNSSGANSNNELLTSYEWTKNNEVISTAKDPLLLKPGNYYLSITNTDANTSSHTCTNTSSAFELVGFFFDEDSVWIEQNEYEIDIASGNESKIEVRGSDYDKAGYATTWSGPYLTWDFVGDEGGTAIITDGTSTRPSIQTTESGTLYYTVTYGPCSDQAKTHIKVLRNILVPEVFTPNGDGLYDSWEIEGLSDFENAKVTVYNRWGSIIYENTGYQKPWDGTNYFGVPAPDAVYYYIIELNKNNKETLKGNVTIIR